MAVLQWLSAAPDTHIASILGVNGESLAAIYATDEWSTTARALHQEFEAKMENDTSRIIAMGLREIEDRILNGDIEIDKFGRSFRVHARLKDLSTTVKTLFDSRKEFQRMAAGKADPALAHAEGLMRIARALEQRSAFVRVPTQAPGTIIDVEDSTEDAKINSALDKLGLREFARE